MRILLVATAVVLGAGCAADTAKTVAVCPAEHQGLALGVLDDITEGSRNTRDTSYVRSDPLSSLLEPVQGPVYFVVPTPLLFQAAQWAEMHPACFSDEARVRVYALRDRAAATGQAGTMALRVERDEYDAVLVALRA